MVGFGLALVAVTAATKKAVAPQYCPFHHPGDTLTPGTLADILAGTGWTDDDLRRLRLVK